MLFSRHSRIGWSLCLMINALLFGLNQSATAAPAAQPDEKPDVKGPVWYGVMDAGPREFRFAIEQSKAEDGTTVHDLVSFDEGSQKFRLDDFQLDEKKLSFKLKISKAEYEGQRRQPNEVAGKWKQAGIEFDLVFRQQETLKQEKPDEVWTGAIHPLFQKLNLQVRVYQREGGSDKVLFDSLSQKSGGFKATRKIEGKQWTLDVASVAGKFVGTLNDEGTEVVGKWSQGALKLDLTLKKVQDAVTNDGSVLRRPQNPKPPFPYSVESVTFENQADQVKLAGTLTIPEGAGPFPAAILITGSGPQDRDESLLDHKPFWVIADYLSRKGIAVLRYDDRGVGGSTGDPALATSEDFSRDAEAAFDFLKGNPKVKPNSIGFIGHSEGGIIAPLIASRRSDTAFIVLLAGTGVNGREILLSQGQLIIKAEGAGDADTLELQRIVQTALINLVLKDDPVQSDATDEQIKNLLTEIREKLPASSLTDATMEESVRAGLKTLQAPWFQFFLTHEPGTVLSKVTCPVLALNGQKDVQVDPQVNLPAIRRALEEGMNKNFEVLELPDLNHLFQTSKTGGISEYQKIEETIAPVALDKISSWILKVVQQADLSNAQSK